jgi:hypothetical protein
MTPGKVVYLMLLTTALAIGVVWQSSVARDVGYSAQELHGELAEREAQNARHRAHLGKLKSPSRVAKLVNWLDLGLLEAAPVRPDVPGPLVEGAAPGDVSEPPEPARQSLRSHE